MFFGMKAITFPQPENSQTFMNSGKFSAILPEVEPPPFTPPLSSVRLIFWFTTTWAYSSYQVQIPFLIRHSIIVTLLNLDKLFL